MRSLLSQSRPVPALRPVIHSSSLRVTRAIGVAALLLAGVAWAQVEIGAPQPLKELLRQHLPPPAAQAGEGQEAYLRDTRRIAGELLDSEGYFSPEIEVRVDGGRVRVDVIPGPRTLVSNVSIDIRGDIERERREALLAEWPLGKGAPFRSADWSEAKQVLLRRLLEVDYPAARLVLSRAEVHPANAEAALRVEYDTGPLYVFGELNISGLARYSPQLVRRYSKIEPGARYDARELLALQAALQRTPYFSSVSVEIAEPDSPPASGPVQAAVNVRLRERAPHRLSFGVGASSNTGVNAEVIYRGADFLRRGWPIEAGLRLEQLRQSLYADVHLRPEGDRRDSVGILTDAEDIQSLKRQRIALGGVRTVTRGRLETRYALNWQREIREPRQAPATTNDALALDGSWILRQVDDPLDPRQGYVAQVQAGGGSKALLSDQNFLRLEGRYQRYFPLGKADVLSLRGELGATLAPSREGIPGSFLFRTGGAQSVRGYGYQSLGVREGNAVVGGRYLAVASAELTHWFDAKWGGAVFVDAGDAGDDRRDLKPALGYGAGARWKSPAGPLALDLAYGERERKVHLHFSLAIAF